MFSFKKIIIFFLILLFIVAFSNSYNTFSIDKLSYVVAIGVDVSDTNVMTFSFQFTQPSSVSENGSSDKSPSIVNSVDANSISSAINLMNTYIGKKLNLSHCKVIVISEQLATEGISELILTFMNDTQIRPSANIVVSKCDAKYYIENSKPILETLITKYYDIFPSSSNYTGYTTNATIGDFFNDLESAASNPVAILGGMNTESIGNTTELNTRETSSSKSNESSIQGKRGSENIGLAIFKNDRMIGELDALGCLSYLNMSGQIKQFLVTVRNPEDSTSYLDLNLNLDDKPKIKVDIINGSPYITIKARYYGRIATMNDNSKYLDSGILDTISSYCSSYLESTFSDYLYKTSKEFKSDINRFWKICFF